MSAETPRTLPERLRRHAASLERSRRSPLYVVLMRAAADDAEQGGVVARVFDGIPSPPGSVPALRLLAALHHLVLSGGAPGLAAFYPSAGGTRPAAEAWPAARAALEEHAEWVSSRLHQVPQTNDPGRSVVLYAGLLWLTERHGLPVRLLELGASAGLNLLADRFCYLVEGTALGDAASPVRFVEPWQRPPDVDLLRASRDLHVAERAGCDVAPLDATDTDHRLTVLSYIWPDELDRLERTRAALDVAARHPGLVAGERASTWLDRMLAAPAAEPRLTVIWHSLFRQYVTPAEWQAIEAAYAAHANAAAPVVWLSMEPGDDHLAGVQLTLREAPGGPPRRLATCDDHGAPVVWADS